MADSRENNIKPYFKYIVVILVYRNTVDLLECIESVKKKIDSVKIVVLNAYYDEDSKNQIEKIAHETDSDFINIENKGYSYGNNVGIQFAMKNYSFEYAIISNPDIVVEKFDDSEMPDAGVVAPKIVAASGKKQNPMILRENRVSEYFVYCGLKKNIICMLAIGIILNKISNVFFNRKHKKQYEIFAAHGSFVIIKNTVVQRIQPLYDENMFLFGEEGVLAYRCRENGFKTVYDANILIRHKEDGCMKLADFSINNELKKSNIYFYEKYILNK